MTSERGRSLVETVPEVRVQSRCMAVAKNTTPSDPNLGFQGCACRSEDALVIVPSDTKSTSLDKFVEERPLQAPESGENEWHLPGLPRAMRKTAAGRD